MNGNKAIATGTTIAVFVVCGLIAIGMWGCPRYNVWQKKLAGEARLRQQEYEKQILVEQAKAEKESAKLLAEAEVERARGIAESMKIISDNLKGNPEYLQYWAIQAQIKMSESPNHTTVYIPVGDNGIPLIRMLEQ